MAAGSSVSVFKRVPSDPSPHRAETANCVKMKTGFELYSYKNMNEEGFIEMKVSSTCRFKMASRQLTHSPLVVELHADRSTPVTSPAADEVPYSPPRFIAAKSVGACKISPSESYKDSSKYVVNDSSTSCRLVNEESRKPSSREINMSSLSLKFKASKAYLGKLFTKTSNLNQSSSSGSTGRNAGDMEKQIQRDNCESTVQGVRLKPSQRRRSFSGALKRSLTPAFSSPPSRSSFSGRVSECQYTKRKDSEISDIENSIQGAIAYCKQSQFQLPTLPASSPAPFIKGSDRVGF